MKDINLIHFKVEDKTKRTKTIILAAMFLVTIVIFISFGTLVFLTKENVNENTAVKKEMNKYAEVNIVKTEMKTYNEKLKQMKDILDSVSGKSVLNIKILKQIAQAMPSDVYIMNYSISKTGEITLVGKSGSNDSIAHFRYKLDESKEFDAIAVKSIKSEESRETKASDAKASDVKASDVKVSGSEANYTFDMSLKLKR